MGAALARERRVFSDRFSHGNSREIKWKLKELNATRTRCEKEKKEAMREEMNGRNRPRTERRREEEWGAVGRTIAQDYDELKIFNFGLRRDWKSYLQSTYMRGTYSVFFFFFFFFLQTMQTTSILLLFLASLRVLCSLRPWMGSNNNVNNISFPYNCSRNCMEGIESSWTLNLLQVPESIVK